MVPMLTWNEVQARYKDRWVVFTEWEEDEHGDVIKGHVAYSHPNRKTFYEYVKIHLRPKWKRLASLYTGNVRGPFFLGV